MAWDSYHGQHRIKVEPIGNHCLAVNLQRKGSAYKNIIARVCQNDAGVWQHNAGSSRHTFYGKFKTARAAIKDAVSSNGSWIGVQRVMDGARKRRRRR